MNQMKSQIRLITSFFISTLISCQLPNTDKKDIDPTPTPAVYSAPAWFTDRGSLAQIASVNQDVHIPLRLRWKKTLPSAIFAPAAGGHGNLYVNAGNTLYAMEPTLGNILWTYQADANDNYPIKNSVAVHSENKELIQRVFLVDGIGNLHAIDAKTGTQIWKVTNDGNENFLNYSSFNSAPVVASERIFYNHRAIGNGSNRFNQLRAVSSSDGSIIWEKSQGNLTTVTPTYGVGSIFMSNCQQTDTPLERINDATGTVDWVYHSQDSVSGLCNTSGVLDSDVELGKPIKYYFAYGESNPNVSAVTASGGTKIWEIALPTYGKVLGFTLTQQRDTNHLIVTQSEHMYSLDPETGALRWNYDFIKNSEAPSGGQSPKPVIWGEYVFHVTNRSVLKAISLANGQEVWSFQLDDETYASPIAGGNTLYIGTRNGSLYAFSPES